MRDCPHCIPCNSERKPHNMPDPIHISNGDRLLNARDAQLAGYNLAELKAQAAWTPEPRALPPELAPEYHAEPYRAPEPRHWANVGEQLDTVMRERLIEYARGVL